MGAIGGGREVEVGVYGADGHAEPLTVRDPDIIQWLAETAFHHIRLYILVKVDDFGN